MRKYNINLVNWILVNNKEEEEVDSHVKDEESPWKLLTTTLTYTSKRATRKGRMVVRGGRKGRLEMSNEGRIFYLFRFAPTPPRHSRRLVFFLPSPLFTVSRHAFLSVVHTCGNIMGKAKKNRHRKKMSSSRIDLDPLDSLSLSRSAGLLIPPNLGQGELFFAVYTRKALSHNTLSWMFNNILFYSFYLENVYLVCEGS